MKTGISTASLFGRVDTLNAILKFNSNGVQTAEVFFESFSEYNRKFGKAVDKLRGKTEINSVHTLITQFEPQLYSANTVAQKDSFGLLTDMLKTAKIFGAKNYTFHGPTRVKQPKYIDIDKTAVITQKIVDECDKFGMNLAYENVWWCYYNYVGYFSELKKRVPNLKATLDIKQAREAKIDLSDIVSEMKSDIVTVHLSDIDENGKKVLPGKGVTDFNKLFTSLKEVGFDGALIIEAYGNDYGKEEELFESLNFITKIANNVF